MNAAYNEGYMAAYLMKTAVYDQSRVMQLGQDKGLELSPQEAAQLAKTWNASAMGKAMDDPSKRGWATTGAGATAGAGIGYALGGGAGALAGSALGGIVGWLANHFFGKDVHKAMQWAMDGYRKGTLQQDLTALREKSPKTPPPPTTPSTNETIGTGATSGSSAVNWGSTAPADKTPAPAPKPEPAPAPKPKARYTTPAQIAARKQHQKDVSKMVQNQNRIRQGLGSEAILNTTPSAPKGDLQKWTEQPVLKRRG